MLSWLALSGSAAADRGLTTTGGRPTWTPRGNETSATDRRYSRNVELLMSFTARSRRNSVTGSTGWPRRQQAPGRKKRPGGPDISNSRRVRRSIHQSSTHRRGHQRLCREDIPANWVGDQHRGGLVHRPHRRWAVAPHVQMAGSLPRQLHRVPRADAFGDCLQFDGGESNTQWLEGCFHDPADLRGGPPL